jgi:hypothetical protein
MRNNWSIIEDVFGGQYHGLWKVECPVNKFDNLEDFCNWEQLEYYYMGEIQVLRGIGTVDDEEFDLSEVSWKYAIGFDILAHAESQKCVQKGSMPWHFTFIKNPSEVPVELCLKAHEKVGDCERRSTCGVPENPPSHKPKSSANVTISTSNNRILHSGLPINFII